MSYAFYLPAPMILAAVALDVTCGDPDWLPHPVRLIGQAIAVADRRFHTGQPRTDLMGGALVSMGVIGVSALTSWTLIALLERVNSYAGALAAILIAWTTLAARGLDQAAHNVERHLQAEDDGSARQAIRALVGRDPERLDRRGLIGAAIESLAENCSDGFVAPLLFLVVAGPVGAISYKAINTLDSMIGYRDDRYLYFGRVAARLDDLVNLLPARLTAASIALAASLVTGRGLESARICMRDAWKHASPNAGYPEAAMAGALGIELGGDAFYAGELEHRPRLGNGEVSIELRTLHSARMLVWSADAIATLAILILRAAILRA